MRSLHGCRAGAAARGMLFCIEAESLASALYATEEASAIRTLRVNADWPERRLRWASAGAGQCQLRRASATALRVPNAACPVGLPTTRACAPARSPSPGALAACISDAAGDGAAHASLELVSDRVGACHDRPHAASWVMLDAVVRPLPLLTALAALGHGRCTSHIAATHARTHVCVHVHLRLFSG